MLNPDEECPHDPYTLSRNEPKHSYVTPPTFDKLKQFITLDRQVLRFYAVWDDRNNMFGEMRSYTLHYYRLVTVIGPDRVGDLFREAGGT